MTSSCGGIISNTNVCFFNSSIQFSKWSVNPVSADPVYIRGPNLVPVRKQISKHLTLQGHRWLHVTCFLWNYLGFQIFYWPHDVIKMSAEIAWNLAKFGALTLNNILSIVPSRVSGKRGALPRLIYHNQCPWHEAWYLSGYLHIPHLVSCITNG